MHQLKYNFLAPALTNKLVILTILFLQCCNLVFCLSVMSMNQISGELTTLGFQLS